MAARKTGLGKGLDALIPPSESSLPPAGVSQIPINRITPNPRQPRSNFNPDELKELADSIREHGVIQPLIVKLGEQPGQYILIAGERRLQASKLANFTEVPVVVREASDQQLLELALIENIQRADLNPLEAAAAYQQLKDDFGLSDEKIGAQVGKSRPAITNTRNLLSLSEPVRNALASSKITETQARPLKTLSPPDQAALLEIILSQELSVRQIEARVKKLKGDKTTPKTKSPEILDIEERLRQALGTRVRVNHAEKGSGQIVIEYFSDEELNRLIDKFEE